MVLAACALISGFRRTRRRSHGRPGREREDYGLTAGRARRRRGWLAPAGIGSRLDAVIRYVDGQLDGAAERLIALCHLCSGSTERALTAEQRTCADWFVKELRGIGFSASVRDAPGRPIVVGHDRGSEGPSVLFCGYCEVGPARLLHDWKDNAANSLASAGSVDQATQLMAFVEACRAWKAVAGQLPTPVSVLVEGEGRLGSARLTSFLRMYADELRADIGLAPAARISCHAVPTINSMLRGLCCEEFVIVPTGSDQLAGRRSEALTNPTRILARILLDLHEPSGQVAIPGFYSGVDPPHLRGTGRFGSIQFRPTCDIDRISGGRGDGGPRPGMSQHAFARLCFHLVCDQDPDLVRQAFRDFARIRVPPSLQIEFTSCTSAPPIRFTISRPAFGKAQDALTAEWGRQAVFACGDAAPVVHALREALGMEVIVTSLPERRDGGRGPRETPEAANYRFGIHAWARILDALSQ